MRFLHIGDLHLGTPFSAFSQRVAASKRAAQFEALEALLRQAVSMGTECLLFAGDCFDSTTQDGDTVRRFFSLIEETALPAFIAPGNHDPYTPGGVWDSVPLPRNACLFRDPSMAFFTHEALKLRVYGYAFTAEALSSPRLPVKGELSGEYINILLAHTELGVPHSPYAPLSPAALAASGFFYAALGHVHKLLPPKQLGETLAAYCGFLMGRGFDEPGSGGALLVDIDAKGQASVTRLESGADRFEVVSLDVSGAADGEAVRARVAAFLDTCTYPATTALKLHLVGEVAGTCLPDMAAIGRLGTGFSLFRVVDETVPLYDEAYLLKEPGILGAFYRAMLPRLTSNDQRERATAGRALRLGLAALAGRELL